MIKPGDIVHLRFKGGLKNNKPYHKTLGLVIKELREKNSIPQYYVQFDKDNPKWYYQHDLYKIRGERNEDANLQNKCS